MTFVKRHRTAHAGKHEGIPAKPRRCIQQGRTHSSLDPYRAWQQIIPTKSLTLSITHGTADEIDLQGLLAWRTCIRET